MSFRLKRSHAPCAASWGSLARAHERRVHRLPQAPRSGALLHTPRRGTEASGLERDARAGISPHEMKPRVLAAVIERISGMSEQRSMAAGNLDIGGYCKRQHTGRLALGRSRKAG